MTSARARRAPAHVSTCGSIIANRHCMTATSRSRPDMSASSSCLVDTCTDKRLSHSSTKCSTREPTPRGSWPMTRVKTRPRTAFTRLLLGFHSTPALDDTCDWFKRAACANNKTKSGVLYNSFNHFRAVIQNQNTRALEKE